MLYKSVSERKYCAKIFERKTLLVQNSHVADGERKGPALPFVKSFTSGKRREAWSLRPYLNGQRSLSDVVITISLFSKPLMETTKNHAASPCRTPHTWQMRGVPLSLYPRCPSVLEDKFVSDMHKNPQKCAESGKDTCPYWGGPSRNVDSREAKKFVFQEEKEKNIPLPDLWRLPGGLHLLPPAICQRCSSCLRGTLSASQEMF